MLSMRGLECLVAIVEEGSLTKAAAVLHMSQPALSHQIAAIERELGTPVIERLPRGIRPPAAGLVASLARAHVQGANVNWAAVLAPGSVVELPTYAFQRERYWPAPAPVRSAAGTGGDGAGTIPHLAVGSGSGR